MRIAFVDLLFTWPPHGGAVVDLHHTVQQLRALGHDTHLFAGGEDGTPERGRFDPGELPYPATRMPLNVDDRGPDAIASTIRDAVARWKPDVVFLCDGFFLKPYVALALADFPVVGRFYAYEMTCLRDHLQFKDGQRCENDYFRTPDVCRVCALGHHRPAILRWQRGTWLREFMAAQAYTPKYYEIALEAAQAYRAIVVYNEWQRELLKDINERVHVVPGGVDPAIFAYVEPKARDRKVILMTGRAEDPLKGLDTLMRAGELLSGMRDDFEIRATHPDRSLSRGWFRSLGWRTHAELIEQYVAADVCVAPSIWEEPFGMVALEAMAVGRPVCASRAGGLQHIVEEGETGTLFRPGNEFELANALERLLEYDDMRLRMGKAARARVEANYTWERVVQTYYPAILEAVAR